LQISTAVAATYAVLEQLFADQQTAKDALRIRQESVALVEQRWKSGLENEASLSQARALMHAAEAKSDTVDRLTALTRNQLAALLGKGPDRGLSIVPVKTRQLRSAGLPASLAVDLIGRRPDVAAARLGAEAAASRIEVANANFYPNVDLTGLYGLQTLDIKYLAQGSSAMGAFGPAIHLPIFDYGRNTGIYRGARAQYDAAVAVYDKTLTGALREVADAYANQRGLAAELKDAHASLAESENAYRIVRLRYDAGLSRYLDVLTAENLLLQQRRAVTDLEAQAFAYDVTLVRALGGGFVEKN
jgi:NodT family efflux transporter outer membrane factor (OMF) lipoprotein